MHAASCCGPFKPAVGLSGAVPRESTATILNASDVILNGGEAGVRAPTSAASFDVVKRDAYDHVACEAYPYHEPTRLSRRSNISSTVTESSNFADGPFKPGVGLSGTVPTESTATILNASDVIRNGGEAAVRDLTSARKL